MANKNLTNARRIKNDEFYTQYIDIQKEIEAYLEYNPNVFRDKVVYCNCDDPFESNFFRYFVLNFNKLGLKQLVTTSYKPSPVANTQLGLFGDDITLAKSKGRPKITANKFIINEVKDMDGDGEFNLKDVAKQLKANKHNEWTPLEKDGDFRSPECIKLLEQSHIVVTNPPFSLFREYLKQLVDYNKKFLIIGSMNALKYANIFPFIKNNKIWLGVSSGAKTFIKPDKTEQKMGNTCWFTNLDHGRRHQPLPLMTKAEVIKFVIKKPFQKYDNYDAIEVSQVKNIPSDYKGAMGVPISFVDKYNPDQFEIIGLGQGNLYRELTPRGLSKEFVDNYYKNGGTGLIKEDHPILGYYDEDGKATIPYMRIIIKHKKK